MDFFDEEWSNPEEDAPKLQTIENVIIEQSNTKYTFSSAFSKQTVDEYNRTSLKFTSVLIVIGLCVLGFGLYQFLSDLANGLEQRTSLMVCGIAIIGVAVFMIILFKNALKDVEYKSKRINYRFSEEYVLEEVFVEDKKVSIQKIEYSAIFNYKKTQSYLFINYRIIGSTVLNQMFISVDENGIKEVDELIEFIKPKIVKKK